MKFSSLIGCKEYSFLSLSDLMSAKTLYKFFNWDSQYSFEDALDNKGIFFDVVEEEYA